MREDETGHSPRQAAAEANGTDLPPQRPHEVIAYGEVDDGDDERREEESRQEPAPRKLAPCHAQRRERPQQRRENGGGQSSLDTDRNPERPLRVREQLRVPPQGKPLRREGQGG